MIHSKHLTISGGDLLLPFTPKQHEIYYGNKEKRILIPKGRRGGFTSSAAAFCIGELLSQRSVLWVDTTENNFNKYFFKFYLPLLKQLKPEFYAYDRKSHQLTIVETKMDFGSSQKPENLEGHAYHTIIINEAGIILKGQKGRDLWYNTILPMTIDFNATVFFIGTPKGKRAKKDEIKNGFKESLYYQLYCKAGGDGHPKHPNYKYFNITSYENPLNTVQVIQELEEELPRISRDQEIKGKFRDINDEPVFKEKWFPIVYELPPDHLWNRKFISMDTAFKIGSENDNSAGVCLLETTVGIFWIDCFNKKLEFPELLTETETFFDDNAADFGIVEDAASGQSLLQMYKNSVHFNLLPVKADRDKFSRNVAVSPICESGKIFVLFGAWNKEAIDQVCEFNACLDTPDDIVDCFCHGLNYIKVNKYPTADPTSRKPKIRSKILKGY
jgi:phage terminase large subunit-like protein